MTDGIAGLSFDLVMMGVIWSVALGFAAGNYACSLVHRLPRGRLLLDKKPYCGHCGTMLQVRDLFPVFSALLLRHKCRYCGAPIPMSHFWTEILVGTLFVLCFFSFNFGQEYLLVALIGIFLVVLASIEANEGVVMDGILVCLVVFAALNRTVMDRTIFECFIGGFYGLIIGLALWRKQIRPVNHVYSIPNAAKLLAVGGICVGAQGIAHFFILFAVFAALAWTISKIPGVAKPIVMTVPFGFAVIVPLLYPKMALSSFGGIF